MDSEAGKSNGYRLVMLEYYFELVSLEKMPLELDFSVRTDSKYEETEITNRLVVRETKHTRNYSSQKTLAYIPTHRSVNDSCISLCY